MQFLSFLFNGNRRFMTDEIQKWPDTERRLLDPTPLRDYSPEAYTGGWGCMVLFAIPFIGAGCYQLAIGMGWIQDVEVHVPRWVIGVVGVIFVLAGSAVFSRGLSRHRHERQLRENRRRFPEEPWMHDYLWDRKGHRVRSLRLVAASWAFVVFMVMFLGVFHVVLFGEPHLLGWLVIGLFDLILIRMIHASIKGTLRWIRFGDSEIRYQAFPFFVGDQVDLVWAPLCDLGDVSRVIFTLRCIEITKQEDEKRVLFQLWADRVVMEASGRWTPGREVPVSFDLPSDVPTTWINRDRPTRWELEAKVERQGLTFEQVYDVPVYSRDPDDYANEVA